MDSNSKRLAGIFQTSQVMDCRGRLQEEGCCRSQPGCVATDIPKFIQRGVTDSLQYTPSLKVCLAIRFTENSFRKSFCREACLDAIGRDFFVKKDEMCRST